MAGSLVHTRNLLALGVVAALLLFALTSTTAEARQGPGGNSAAAQLCQDEWPTLLTSDGKSFKNAGQCTSYAAKGGQFATPPLDPEADRQAFCTELGGVLTTEERQGNTVWICQGIGELPPEDQVDDSRFCTGLITTEVRQGQLVLVCTPTPNT